MSDPLRQPAAPAPTASTSEFVVTFAVIVVLIVVFLAADMSFARVDRRASSAHAASLYAEGQALLANGQPHMAVDRFVAAVANERSNVRYQLALGEALLADGRLEEAEATLNAVLAREPMDGAANIAMARVLTQAKRMDEAKSFYHRAIYGRWGADSAHSRIASRLELIDLLVARGSKRELLAELLPLEEVMPDSIILRRRIGHLFIVAGSPARGARIFRDLLRRNPADGDAYRGMGEAALSLGNFQTARADLRQAFHLLPQDTAIATRLALADTILAINPLERGLSTHERFVRARDIVARTLARGSSCTTTNGMGTERAASARHALTGAVRQQDEATTSQQLLALASDLYVNLPASCSDVHSASDEALAMIQAHLPQ
jgi:tetratricopeptide (TPR) repeat protein